MIEKKKKRVATGRWSQSVEVLITYYRTICDVPAAWDNWEDSNSTWGSLRVRKMKKSVSLLSCLPRSTEYNCVENSPMHTCAPVTIVLRRFPVTVGQITRRLR